MIHVSSSIWAASGRFGKANAMLTCAVLRTETMGYAKHGCRGLGVDRMNQTGVISPYGYQTITIAQGTRGGGVPDGLAGNTPKYAIHRNWAALSLDGSNCTL